MILQLISFEILIFLSSPANILARPPGLLQSNSSCSCRNVAISIPFRIGEWFERGVDSEILQISPEETAVNANHRPILDFRRQDDAIREYIGSEKTYFFFHGTRNALRIVVIGNNELAFIFIRSTDFVIGGSHSRLPVLPLSLNHNGPKLAQESAENVHLPYLVAHRGKYNHSRKIPIGIPRSRTSWEVAVDCLLPWSNENFDVGIELSRWAANSQQLSATSFYGLFMIVAGTSLGSLFMVIGGMYLCKKMKDIKLKEKFFKQNGGLLLQQMLNSSDGVILDRCKLFSSKELDKATNHFNVNRILGQGGQGTVYKGMLEDGGTVAVKKSKIVDEEKLEEFINELVILSQINHRNVVKLLGCCLETEVPSLVYEFIPNGTLFEYIHRQNEESLMSWEMRLRIAIDVAGALAYLHSAAAVPIYHRDIKSTNILLDEKCRAKVADFGTSKVIAIDQTHVTTKIVGTLGYLDPEYHQSRQLTDKSDVYSFGVILVELLTGKKPIFSTTSRESTSLAAYFLHLVKKNRLNDIFDDEVMDSMGKKNDQIMAFANLARRCLDQNGKKRPTMEEVSMELKRIRALKKKRSGMFSKIMKRLSLKETKINN